MLIPSSAPRRSTAKVVRVAAIALTALLALALIAGSCRGGSDGAGSPAAGTPTPAASPGNGSPTPPPSPTDGVTPTNSTPAPGEESLRAALKMMVIQEEDLPDGIQLVGQGFSSNDELIQASDDPVAKRAELAATGRIMGFAVTFQPGPDVIADTPLRGVNASASLYETDAGAAESFAQASKEATETDWQAANPDLQQFRTRTIELDSVADELLWLRLSGLSTSPEGIIVDDAIIFRVGRERGFLRVLATAPGKDRDLLLDVVEGWLRAQIRRVNEQLSAGLGT